MADEFETGICSGNWWSSNNNSTSAAIRKSSPISCSTSALSSFGWPTISTTNTSSTQHEMMMINEKATRSSSSRDYPSAAVSSVTHESSPSINVFQQDITSTIQHNNPAAQRISSEDSSGGDTAMFMDSANLQIMGGFDLQSSPTTDWTQLALLNRSSGRSDNSDFQSMIEEEDLSSNRRKFQQEPSLESDQIFQKDWSTKNYSTCGEDSSTINAFKQINQQVFGLDTQQFNSSTTPYGCGSSTLLQGLFEPDDDQQQHIQQSSYENHRGINYQSPTTNYHHVNNSSNELSSNSWPKFPQFLKSLPSKQQLTTSVFPSPQTEFPHIQLQFSNNTPFWNPSTSVFPSPQTEFLTAQTIDEKPNCSSSSNSNKHTLKPKTEEVRDSSSLAKKTSTEPTFKRPRIETPSPLPTFKVRKEKLGDRITALQQLVSPFGKTDTASVLYEAIEYIKFLHEQVTVLSNPYMKNNGAPIQYQHHQVSDHKLKDGQEKPKQDLRSRGLCLVPISSTFPVANEHNTDFWNPTFGGTYR